MENFSTNSSARDYGFFLANREYCLAKGKGFSLFNASAREVENFVEQCLQQGLQPLIIKLSDAEALPPKLPEPPAFVILVQDLSYTEFLGQASALADKLIFPLWFKRIAICFFSALGQGDYPENPVSGEALHKNYSGLINGLLSEQILTLLERANYQFSAPEFLNITKDKTIFTPIEERLRAALEKHQVAYQPQVRLGRYTVDFLVGERKKHALSEANGVIVECDGRDYHEPGRDQRRDNALSVEGYPICHFSGAEIYADADKCVEKIQKSLARQVFPAYALETNLDNSQKKAVEGLNGPIRVLAPAGSGKTKTLVNRILFLLNQGVPAEKILALAFNKKASDEMQARLERKGLHEVEVRTFHSLGYEIVRAAFRWNFNGTTYHKTVRDLLRASIQQHTELPPLRNKDPLDAFLDGLRRAKMELSPLETLTVDYGERIYPFEPIFYTYLEKQLGANFLDFDDMIYLALRALLNDSALRRGWQSKFEFVLVDEFQDLNQAQLLLLQVLALPENNIFAVGDDDQMIYGFRGAEVKYLVEFDRRFPLSTSHVLNTNYRSSRMIVRHSGWLIGHNTARVEKDIQPGPHAAPGRFEISGQPSIIQQAEYAARWIADHKRENNLNWRDYAILFRYNAYQFPAALLLDTLDIPHTPLSGQSLFQTAAGRDVYAYLGVILEPTKARQPDLERILKRPNKYLSNSLIAQARNWTSFQRLPKTPDLRDWEQAKLADFVSRIERLSERVRTQSISAGECLLALKTEIGLGDFYRDQSRKSDDLDQASDEIYFDVMTALSEKYKTAAEFYQFVRESRDENEMDSTRTGHQSKNEEPETNQVYLSSIHKAKGKEFQVVIYFNMSQTDISAANIEEERRIVYVGVTRPKDDLLVTFSSVKPSGFLWELAQNPKFKDWHIDLLTRQTAGRKRRLAKEEFRRKQLEAEREKAVAAFEALTLPRAGEKQRTGWLHQIQMWRINRAEQKVNRQDEKIRQHAETTLVPLKYELAELDEEINLRYQLRQL